MRPPVLCPATGKSFKFQSPDERKEKPRRNVSVQSTRQRERSEREIVCDCCCAKGSFSRSSARRIQLDGENVTGLQLCTQTVIITRLRLVPMYSAITMLTSSGCWGYKLVISLLLFLLHSLRSSSSSPPPLGTGG